MGVTGKPGLWIVLLIGGVIRAAFLVFFFADLSSDPDAYKKIAVNWRISGVYGLEFGDSADEDRLTLQPTAFRPPLYPVLLTGLVVESDPRQAAGEREESAAMHHVSPVGIAGLHWLLGMLTIGCAYQLGRNFGWSDGRSSILASIVAFDPIALRQSCLPMTETLAILLATVGLWYFTRPVAADDCRTRLSWRALGGGILLGLATLCRPTFLIWAGLMLLLEIGRGIRRKNRQRQRHGLAAVWLLIGLLIALAPWTVRNWLVFGKPIFATTHGGYTLFLGNNNYFYDYLRSGKDATWDGETELRGIVSEIRAQSLIPTDDGDWIVDEVHKDRLYYEQALAAIQDRPGDFVYACGVRVLRFWSLFPRLPEAEDGATPSRMRQWIAWGSAAWYLVVDLLALVGLVRWIRGKSDPLETSRPFGKAWWPGLLLVIAFQGLHLFYWSNMRMRAPLVAWMALLAVMSHARSWPAESESEK